MGRLVQVLVTLTKKRWGGQVISIINIQLPRPFQDTDHERNIIDHGLEDDEIMSNPNSEMYAFLLTSSATPVRGEIVHFSLLLRRVTSDKYPVAYERLSVLRERCPYDEPSTQLNWSLFANTTEETITIV